MRLVGADSGQSLASLSGSANGAKDLIPTIGGLTRSLRRQMGESLKHVQASAELAQVTTASVDALEKYTAAQRAMTQGDPDKAIPLFKEAVKIDTGFASAYRALAVALSNRGLDREGQIAAMERAYADTARLPETERWLAVATYWTQGPHPNEAKAAEAYKSLLAIRPTQYAALNNLALLYANQRQFDSAAALLRRSVAANPAGVTSYNNLITNEAELGKWSQVDSTAAVVLKVSGNNPRVAMGRATYLFARGQYDSTIAFMDSLSAANPTDEFLKAQRNGVAGIVATTRGQIAEGMRLTALNTAYNISQGNVQAALGAANDSATIAVWFFRDTAKALSIVQNALKRVPLTSFQPLDRPYGGLAQTYALMGKPDLARSMLTEFDRIAPAYTQEAASRTRHGIESIDRDGGTPISRFGARVGGGGHRELHDLQAGPDGLGVRSGANARFGDRGVHEIREFDVDPPTLSVRPIVSRRLVQAARRALGSEGRPREGRALLREIPRPLEECRSCAAAAGRGRSQAIGSAERRRGPLKNVDTQRVTAIAGRLCGILTNSVGGQFVISLRAADCPPNVIRRRA